MSKTKAAPSQKAPKSDKPKSKKAAPEPSEESAELQRLREERQQLQDSLARAQAELANVQKRHARERESEALYRVEPLARELLEILDAMEEAREAMTREEGIPDAVREGQEMTLRHMLNIFERFSVQGIDPEIGTRLDPSLHEAVGMEPSEEAAPGGVIRVLCKGYRLHDRLLRPSRVVVARAPEPKDEDEPAKEPESGASDAA